MNTENRATVTTKSGVRLRFTLDPATDSPVFLGRIDDIENTDEHIGVSPSAARRKAAAILRRKKAEREKKDNQKREQKKKKQEKLEQLKLL